MKPPTPGRRRSYPTREELAGSVPALDLPRDRNEVGRIVHAAKAVVTEVTLL